MNWPYRAGWSRSSSGAAMAEEVEGGGLLRRRLFMEQQIDTARYTSSDLPSIMPPTSRLTLHLAWLPASARIRRRRCFAGHMMRIRMTSLSLQPNDASTLQPSLNAVQWCGVDCPPLHLLVYSLILTLVIVSPSRRAEEQDMHGVRTVQVSLLS